MFRCMKKERNVAVFLAVVVGAVLCIEFTNRTAVEPPRTAAYYPCADSDAMPYSTRCIEFMMGSHAESRPRPPVEPGQPRQARP